MTIRPFVVLIQNVPTHPSMESSVFPAYHTANTVPQRTLDVVWRQILVMMMEQGPLLLFVGMDRTHQSVCNSLKNVILMPPNLVAQKTTMDSHFDVLIHCSATFALDASRTGVRVVPILIYLKVVVMKKMIVSPIPLLQVNITVRHRQQLRAWLETKNVMMSRIVVAISVKPNQVMEILNFVHIALYMNVEILMKIVVQDHVSRVSVGLSHGNPHDVNRLYII